jgi:hypothetical protein
VATHFGDSVGESTTSSTSSMKGGNSDHNGFDLNKGNILKPTFDTLMEEGGKAFEVYRTNLEELFLSHCEVTRQGTIFKDTTPIIFTKPEEIPEVQPNLLSSLNDVQNMINSALERQAKSTDELLRRLIEERDGKNIVMLMSILLLSLALLIFLKPIHIHVVHQWAALQCRTPLPSRRITSTAEPPSRVRFLILGCHNKLRPACMSKGTHTPHLALLYQTLVRPPIPPGLMVKHTLTLAATSKPRTPP